MSATPSDQMKEDLPLEQQLSCAHACVHKAFGELRRAAVSQKIKDDKREALNEGLTMLEDPVLRLYTLAVVNNISPSVLVVMLKALVLSTEKMEK